MTDRDLLKMALEALEGVLCDPEGKCCIDGSDADRAIVDATIAALRAALDEQEPEPEAPARRPLTDEEINRIVKSIHPDMMLPDAKRLFARLIEQAHGITGGNDE